VDAVIVAVVAGLCLLLPSRGRRHHVDIVMCLSLSDSGYLVHHGRHVDVIVARLSRALQLVGRCSGYGHAGLALAPQPYTLLSGNNLT
jgi:hypothetical protein